MPRKVIAFSCGSGSFFEYEQIKALNDEKCGKKTLEESKEEQANGPSAQANAGKKAASTFFDQIIYGADHVFTPTQFIGELRQMVEAEAAAK